ncbi:MAG: hypothetical protein AAFX50_11995 [Acidobacteriota bacterium]
MTGGPIGPDAFTKIADLSPRTAASLLFLDDETLLIFGGINAQGQAVAETQVIDVGDPPIFADGFESGSTENWSLTVP